MNERMAGPTTRYVGNTPLARWLHERIGVRSLQEVERQSRARGVPLLSSSLSNYLTGAKENLSTETVRRMAVFFEVPEREICALLPAYRSGDRYVTDSSGSWSGIEGPPPAAITDSRLRLAFYGLAHAQLTEEEMASVLAEAERVLAKKWRERMGDAGARDAPPTAR